MTIQEIFEGVKARVEANPEKFRHLNASYQFELTGEGGGIYHAQFAGGMHSLGKGAIANPGCKVSVSAENFQQMLDGKLNATAAFMSGKLRITGDMGLAMKLQMLIG